MEAVDLYLIILLSMIENLIHLTLPLPPLDIDSIYFDFNYFLTYLYELEKMKGIIFTFDLIYGEASEIMPKKCMELKYIVEMIGGSVGEKDKNCLKAAMLVRCSVAWCPFTLTRMCQ